MSRSIFLNETGLLPDLVGMEIDYSTSTNASEFSTQFQCFTKNILWDTCSVSNGIKFVNFVYFSTQYETNDIG